MSHEHKNVPIIASNNAINSNLADLKLFKESVDASGKVYKANNFHDVHTAFINAKETLKDDYERINNLSLKKLLKKIISHFNFVDTEISSFHPATNYEANGPARVVWLPYPSHPNHDYCLISEDPPEKSVPGSINMNAIFDKLTDATDDLIKNAENTKTIPTNEDIENFIRSC